MSEFDAHSKVMHSRFESPLSILNFAYFFFPYSNSHSLFLSSHTVVTYGSSKTRNSQYRIMCCAKVFLSPYFKDGWQLAEVVVVVVMRLAIASHILFRRVTQHNQPQASS